MTKLGKRELSVLSDAIRFDMRIHVTPRGLAFWDWDRTMSFRAFAALESLIGRDYFERMPGFGGHWEARTTAKARDLKCRDCMDGRTYEEDPDSGYDRENGKCATCNGTCIDPARIKD